VSVYARASQEHKQHFYGGLVSMDKFWLADDLQMASRPPYSPRSQTRQKQICHDQANRDHNYVVVQEKWSQGNIG
jgi:hypothetical protein